MVLPAHGAGSLCGAHLSDSPKSTIGAERASNPNLQHKNRSDYIASVLRDLPEAPQYFGHNAAMNRRGPPPVDWAAPLPAETAPDASLAKPAKFFLADIRDPAVYAADHISGSVNIGLRGRFETWTGMMAPWAAQESGRLVLIGAPNELKEALHRLHRIGYTAGVLTPDRWKAAKLPTKKVELIKPADLHAQTQAGTAPIIVDVRLPNEWMGLRIGEILNLPLNRLAELSAKLDPSLPIVTVCNSAYRSSMAIGILEAKGFRSVTSLAGGSEAWIAAGLPTYGAQTGPSAGAVRAKRDIRLAERMSPEELRRLAKDLPGTFDLVDIRPADQFADYNIPGSANADIADLLHNPAYLVGAGPLIIVDRDGSLAMQVAGILSQKTQRTVKALHGGLESYWKESVLKDAAKPSSSPPGAAPPPAEAPKGAPQPPKKKSAGC